MMHTWEAVVEQGTQVSEQVGVRRLQVLGGWLYQVETYCDVGGRASRLWGPPVFVPNGAIMKTLAITQVP